ncbi:MAG: hypothetical protein HYS17_00750 [Micavibrio aeruginosavorus]|uniref:Uncharacterized protein n=1 Tax=Micavibrio aeruginosavorus TaxID=349221 RepID=A0A7T5R2Q8_9BACT|nr:MAG: hypothetical protein HYS17_00750 [Micavibrio aeruginosavorus]
MEVVGWLMLLAFVHVVIRAITLHGDNWYWFLLALTYLLPLGTFLAFFGWVLRRSNTMAKQEKQ